MLRLNWDVLGIADEVGMVGLAGLAGLAGFGRFGDQCFAFFYTHNNRIT
jgi:hypothetical protein